MLLVFRHLPFRSLLYVNENCLKSFSGVEGAAPGLTAAPPNVTRQQLVKFHKAVTTAEQPRQVSDAIRDFSRLWR